MALAVAGESDLGKCRRLSAWFFRRLFWHCNQPEHVGARTPYSDERLSTYAAQKCLILANGASLRRDFIGCTTGAPSKHVHLALSNRASGNSPRCAMRSTVSLTNPLTPTTSIRTTLIRTTLSPIVNVYAAAYPGARNLRDFVRGRCALSQF